MSESACGGQSQLATFTIDGYASEHRVGDAHCDEGLCGKPQFPLSGPFPMQCRCGGLVHADATFSGIDHPYWAPDRCCDCCGDQFEAIDPLEEELLEYMRRRNAEEKSNPK